MTTGTRCIFCMPQANRIGFLLEVIPPQQFGVNMISLQKISHVLRNTFAQVSIFTVPVVYQCIKSEKQIKTKQLTCPTTRVLLVNIVTAKPIERIVITKATLCCGFNLQSLKSIIGNVGALRLQFLKAICLRH